MKVLITGANGQLGTELQQLLTMEHSNNIAMSSKELDITDAAAVNRCFNLNQPDVVYDCAAYTAVDAAEEEPGKTINYSVNVEGTRNVAVAAERINATLVYVSTDFVFDGSKVEMYSENDVTNPQNEYGRAKLEGERIVQRIMSNYYIVRTSWVFGEFGKNFVYTMRKLAETHHDLSVVDDQIGRPTWTKDLGMFLVFLVQQNAKHGVYQFSNEGQCSWFDFAKEILEKTDVVVHPIDSAQFPQKAFRPQHSVMSLDKVKSLGFKNQTWQDALHMFLKTIEMHR